MLRWFNSQQTKASDSGGFPTDGLVAYYNFNDISTSAVDVYSSNDVPVGGSNLLTTSDIQIGTSTRKGVTGFTNNSYFKDSTPAFVEENEIDKQLGISVWVKRSNNTNISSMFQLGAYENATSANQIIGWSNISNAVRIRSRIAGDVFYDILGTMDSTEFHLVSYFFNSTTKTFSLWVDGVLVDEQADAATEYNSRTNGGFIIGAGHIGGEEISWFMEGYLSDMSIWTEFDTAKHIELYNSGNGLFYT